MSETSKFTEDILTAAKEKARSMITQAETETQQALDEAKAHMSREADDIISNARTEAEGAKRRQMSEVRHRLKLQEEREKSKIMSEVFETTKKRILEVVNDDAMYLPYLVGYVEIGIHELGVDNVLIHLNALDLKRIDKGKLEREVTKRLQRPAKIEWAKEPVESLGGVVVSSSDGKTRIVNTLDERFEALDSKLLMEAGRLLFGK